MDLAKFYNQFREETIENVRVLNDGLLALEHAPDDGEAKSQVHAMFRAMHTIKGSARLLGFESIGRLAHTMEDILGAVREDKYTLNRSLTDQLLRSGDVILELAAYAVEGQEAPVDVEALVQALAKSAQGEPVEAPATSPPDSTDEQPSTGPQASQSDSDGSTKQRSAPPAASAAQAHNGDRQTDDGVEPMPVADATDSASTPDARQRSGPIRTRSVTRDTVRVRIDRLDRLLNLTGELVINQQILATHSQALRELVNLNIQQERALLALENELLQQQSSQEQQERLNLEVNTLLNTCDQMRQLLRVQVEAFNLYINHHHTLVDDLEQEVITTRLLPISTVFGALPRAVRELANATNKEVDLQLYGENTELDRKLLEALNDPLLHLVRNAIDHGVELPEEREALGKPRTGCISVNAEAVGGEVRISISDDGRGMDPQRMREAAVRKGLVSAESAAMLSDQEAIELVFLPGFSTAQILTDISGRGVGMDVVRTNISELSGQVALESSLGQGSTVTLLLPLTLVTTRVLLVQVGTQLFALPASGCRGITWVAQDKIYTIEGRAMIEYNGATVPIIRLADLLGVDAEPAFSKDTRMPAVMLGSARRLMSLLVDQVLDEREAVVKPVGPLLEFQRRYTGAVQLGDGRLVLMLNPMTLTQTARGVTLIRSSSSATSARQQSRLLIADDSFTTRELIRSILHSAGYDVTAAVDGADALDKLRAGTYDLVVSDVEMPRMNGFELTTSIRQELGLRDLPVIIVTSLASDEHKRRGMEAGAQAYIVKSQFNQDNLLNAIQQLLGD